MIRQVRWSRKALDDLKIVLTYISADDADAGQRVVDRIRAAGDKLGDFATGHPARVAGLYEKLVPRLPYIIAYGIDRETTDQTIVIIRVIHASRNWPEGEWPE